MKWMKLAIHRFSDHYFDLYNIAKTTVPWFGSHWMGGVGTMWSVVGE